jgi:membrane protease YdiL (CAAX protease family)
MVKKQETKISIRKLAHKNISAVLLIVSLWWVFWLGSQSLFMIDIPLLSNWLLSSEPYINFTSVTIWIVAVNLIALALYHWLQRDYSFLKIRDKWDVLAYIIPLGLIILLLATKPTAFDVPILIYIIAMIVTIFCQELLTTGFMQTALSKYVGSISAAIVTCATFYLGHFMIAETFTYMGIIMVTGFMLFSWLRFKRGNIYLANVLHLSWSLVMVLAF